MRCAIVGKGNIGLELYNKLKDDVKFIVDVDGIYSDVDTKIDELDNLSEHISGIDVAFIAIPSFKKGVVAKKYFDMFLSANVFVVTCEKGALGYCFAVLKNNLDKIGYNATVGGGSHFLGYLDLVKNENLKEIHAVVNGTMNYIFDEVSSGVDFEDAVNAAKENGYIEPGADTPIEIFNMEATSDVVLKASILFNLSGLSKKVVSPEDFHVSELNEDDILKLKDDASNRRLMVSIAKEDCYDGEGVVKIVEHKIDSWVFCVGFQDIGKNVVGKEGMLPKKVNNIIFIDLGDDGKYCVTGPGAGPKPTTQAMIADAKRLLKNG